MQYVHDITTIFNKLCILLIRLQYITLENKQKIVIRSIYHIFKAGRAKFNFILRIIST